LIEEHKETVPTRTDMDITLLKVLRVEMLRELLLPITEHIEHTADTVDTIDTVDNAHDDSRQDNTTDETDAKTTHPITETIETAGSSPTVASFSAPATVHSDPTAKGNVPQKPDIELLHSQSNIENEWTASNTPTPPSRPSTASDPTTPESTTPRVEETAKDRAVKPTVAVAAGSPTSQALLLPQPSPHSLHKKGSMTKGQLRRKQERQDAIIKNKKPTQTQKTTKGSFLNPLSPLKKTTTSPTKLKSKKSFGRKSSTKMIDERSIIHGTGRNGAAPPPQQQQLLAAFTNVQRHGPGQWSALPQLSPEPKQYQLSPVKGHRQRQRIKMPKKDTLNLGMVNSMFESIHRHNSSPLPPPIDLDEMPPMCKTSSASSSMASPPLTPLRLHKQSPERMKRINAAADVYNKSSSKNKYVNTSFLPTIDWSKAWEHSLDMDRQDDMEEAHNSRNEQTNVPTESKKKKKKKRKRKKRAIPHRIHQLEEPKDLFDSLLDLEKWLHRSFLKVKDACAGMNNELTVSDFTRLFIKLGLKMKQEEITNVFQLIVTVTKQDEEKPCEATLDLPQVSLQSLDTSIRQLKKNRRIYFGRT